MFSKALILLASSAVLAGAHSAGDAPYAAANQVFVPKQDPHYAFYNNLNNVKHALGPSQHHHHTSGPSKQWPHPSATWTGSGDDHGKPAMPTLALTRSHGSPTLALTRGREPTDKPTMDKDDHKDKPWHKPGASQSHHHKPGPSQYHHHKDGGEVKHPYIGSDKGDDSKVRKGSDAKEYAPYVEHPAAGGSHGGAASGGNTSTGPADMEKGDHNNTGDGIEGNHGKNGGKDTGSNGGDDTTAPHWGPSASARARLSDKTKQDGLYALYGQAAADACGFDAQMPGAEITACPLESGSGWDCLNLASTLESCGGCLSIGEGQDCTLIQGAESVGCIHGKCVIGTCEPGFYLDSDKGECVAN